MRYFQQLFVVLVALVLWSCDGSNSQLKNAEEDAYLQERADAIHSALLEKLRTAYADTEHTVWSDTKLSLAPDWIVQTPEDLWGIDTETLSIPLDCDPKYIECEPTFKRTICESNADCSGVGRCEPMAATVKAPGEAAKNLCIGRADRLINRVYSVMTSAESELDLASLSMPTGRFRAGVVNALSYLSHKPEVPRVRLLFSGAVSAMPDLLHPTKKALDELMQEVEAISPMAARLQINLAWLSPGDFSWNHAKIVVADGELAISGGHNLWDDAYLVDNPVFDLSMEYRGEGAAVSRDFLNTLWSYVTRTYSTYPTGVLKFEPFAVRPQTLGNVRAISLGRLGKLGANPSDDILKAMIDLAETSVVIDQQDLYNQIFAPFTKTFVFDNIVNAAIRGVQVQIIQSNKFPLFAGYGYAEGRDVYKALIDETTKRLVSLSQIPRDEARAKACSAIQLASFRFSQGVEKWPYKDSVIGNHAKMLMIDNVAFYLGSHNLYPANLQEFGFVVTDPESTADLRREYWDKIWSASASGAYPCPE